MDRYPRRRFSRGLSSGLFLFVIFAVACLFDANIMTVTADGLSALGKQAISIALSSSPKKAASNGSASETEEGDMHDFHATAYSLKGPTASGVHTRPGIIAADPRVLPIGTVVHIKAGRYTGTYTVLDTGGRIKGRKVDIYIPSYREARQFGRQRVKVKVIKRAR